MVDLWLLILTIVGSISLLVANVFLFYLYSHPKDNTDGVGWFSRIIVIGGSVVITSFILLLPLDVANARGDGGGLDTNLLY